MGLFGKRKTRAIRRAEARAIKQRAKLDAKLAAKNEARRIKSAQRAEAKALKAQLKAQRDSDRAALKAAETQLKAAREGKLLSPTRIRRVLTVSRLLAPIVVPLVYRAAMAVRGQSTSVAPTGSGCRWPRSVGSRDTARGCRPVSPALSKRFARSMTRTPKMLRPNSSSPRSANG